MGGGGGVETVLQWLCRRALSLSPIMCEADEFEFEVIQDIENQNWKGAGAKQRKRMVLSAGNTKSISAQEQL